MRQFSRFIDQLPLLPLTPYPVNLCFIYPRSSCVQALSLQSMSLSLRWECRFGKTVEVCASEWRLYFFFATEDLFFPWFFASFLSLMNQKSNA